ncbi:alpha-amylase family glycosyl hydrolase [Alteromonas gilva]|uniref:Alpha-amylase family glycosyl hydrolase n=1 Tax=Alteromonas gilva TaxID=2987522 RepID=A0ABT5KYP7_9ALTE|nr:alpha-amylase family glycosyl hydrolase [Alteromonas gilva]MDC8829895.1 alpha-amylase family glycosyl hydrolase [Alteromonas gilva]
MNYAASSKQCLDRILQGLDLSFLSQRDKKLFGDRLRCHFDELFNHYIDVYGHQYDCYFHLSQLVMTLAHGLKKRSSKLKQLDKTRSHNNALWYQQENQVGMACYVDLMGPTLKDLQNKIHYFKALGVTYLHLMPLYDSPQGDSDGGYAVSDYRKVNPCLGNMKDLASLASAFQDEGINLVLDFVFNHTADEHRWAQAALAGDSHFQDYYYLFDDREIPDQYEQNLREIFPQVRRGSFTWNETLQKWVWTTFNSFQWDLNYSNPAVFNAITEEMLFLANIGCAALRLDALAFIWKQMGTDCENQPKAHTLIQAFKCCLQIAAPAVIFKSEAIVHPDEVLRYIRNNECQLSYNPLLMALVWNSLATRKTRLLTTSMQKSFTIPQDCSWVNYVRCHDDIGWTFDDSVARQLGINPYDHRYFLNQFFTGRFSGSFANGVPFAENPSNGDCRVCGSLASLCGLEGALANNDRDETDLAIKRILLVHSIIFSIGGIPLLYSGDELGLLNDYSYRDDPAKRHDDRWVNRIAVTTAHIDNIEAPVQAEESLHRQAQKRVFQTLKSMLSIRKSQPLFGAARTHILSTENQHCFVYCRTAENDHKMLVVCNFSEQPQTIDASTLRVFAEPCSEDLLSGATVNNNEPLALSAYQQYWLIGH